MRAALLLALGGCLITSVEGDPGPEPQLGTEHACRIEVHCGATITEVLELRACSDDTHRLQNRSAVACWKAHGMACTCLSHCEELPAPCFFYPDEDP